MQKPDGIHQFMCTLLAVGSLPHFFTWNWNGTSAFFTTLPLSTSVVNFCVTLLGSVSSSSRTCLIFVTRRSVRVLEKSLRITTRSTVTCWASGGMLIQLNNRVMPDDDNKWIFWFSAAVVCGLAMSESEMLSKVTLKPVKYRTANMLKMPNKFPAKPLKTD
ncbi:hypothetical protein ACET3Z_017111 [Daucus carota]